MRGREGKLGKIRLGLRVASFFLWGYNYRNIGRSPCRCIVARHGTRRFGFIPNFKHMIQLDPKKIQEDISSKIEKKVDEGKRKAEELKKKAKEAGGEPSEKNEEKKSREEDCC